MYSEVCSTNIQGLSAHIVTVEVDVGAGLPTFEMSGYLANEVKESRERVRVAIKNSGFELRPQKIMINISPADMRKDGTGFDLPIAVGILAANQLIPKESLKNTVILGELSLDGTVNAVNGVLPSVCEARNRGYSRCIVPMQNTKEASVIQGIHIYGVNHLITLTKFLLNQIELPIGVPEGPLQEEDFQEEDFQEEDFLDILGQQAAKRATLVATAGMHNLMYIGSPGCGKTMMAKRIPTIMPDLSYEDSLELTKVYSIAGQLNENEPLITKRPFVSPHHNITATALLGGGSIPKPGKITLAGKGVLFLDEMTEYKPAILESLRQPLEDKYITIVRLNYFYVFPADCMLVAAINPCKCGYYPDRNRCHCSESEIKRFIGKISRPMWDRFDICIQVDPVSFSQMRDGLDNTKKKEQGAHIYNSTQMKAQVEQARRIQVERFAKDNISFNSEMNTRMVHKYCKLGTQEKQLMDKVFDKLNITARGYHKILKTARTIADLSGESAITVEHLSEAISYRSYRVN